MSPRHQLQDAAGDRKTEGGLFFSVAVPCYNEEPVIAASYRRLKATCQAQGAGYEIIFGNDGSSDGTPGILEEIAAADSCVKVTSHYPNRGAGYTYREMYKKARGEIIIQTDADLAMPPEVSVPALLGALEGADVAVGSRFLAFLWQLFDRRVAPEFDQVQDRLVAPATGDALHQLGMRDRIKVA